MSNEISIQKEKEPAFPTVETIKYCPFCGKVPIKLSLDKSIGAHCNDCGIFFKYPKYSLSSCSEMELKLLKIGGAVNGE